MSRIVRISQAAFPHLPARAKVVGTPESDPAAAEVRIIDPAHRTASARRAFARPGPDAPFLAQYVDQHWQWPRDPAARIRARGTAAQAYETTDRLPTTPAQGRNLNRKA